MNHFARNVRVRTDTDGPAADGRPNICSPTKNTPPQQPNPDSVLFNPPRTKDVVLDVTKADANHMHWLTADGTFSAVEKSKRDANLLRSYDCRSVTKLLDGKGAQQLASGSSKHVAAATTKLFFSHCWRGEESQQLKRRLYSELTDDGNVFWADFLDLQAQGPVPWRKEIGTGIQKSNKVVALIDKEYLLSFNCLEELAYAIHYNKPLVLGLLDQTAWDLLTMVKGHGKAWAEPPASGCSALSDYEGQLFGPTKQPFSLRAVQEIFNVLSAVNFCPCRELDVNLLGVQGVANRLCQFVAKDLDYTKEHAVLQSKADAWVENDRPSSLLLSGRQEVAEWDEWVKVSMRADMFPKVSETQKEFVTASLAQMKRKFWLLKAVGVAVVAIIFLLMVVSIVMAVIAAEKTKVAEAQTKIAAAAALDAQTQAANAVYQERVAAAMLLSSEESPVKTAQSRAMIRAAEVASFIGYPNLVAPRLLAAAVNQASKPLWFFHISKHSARIQSVDFSPDGNSIASAGYDGHFIVQPLPREDTTGSLGDSFLPVPATHTTLSCGVAASEGKEIAWSPDGLLLAASCEAVVSGQDEVIIWRAPTSASGEWEAISHYVGPLEFNAMAWWPNTDRHVLALGAEAEFLAIWDVDMNTNLSAVQPVILPADMLLQATRALSWTPSGSHLASSGTTNEIIIWEVGADLSASVIARGEEPNDDDINALAFSGDGSLLASGGDDNLVIIWDAIGAISGGSPGAVAELVALQVLPPHGAAVYGVAWTPSMQLLSAGHDNIVRRYTPSESANGTLSVPFTLLDEMHGEYGKINDLKVSPVEPLLIAAPSHSNMISFWQDATDLGPVGPEQFRMNCSQEIIDTYGDDEVLQTRGDAWSSDGNLFAVSTRQGYVCVWERKGSEWEVTGALSVLGLPAIREIQFSPSAKWLAIGDDDGNMKVWQRDQAGSWEGKFWLITPDDGKIRTVSWSPDEAVLAFGSQNGMIGVWRDPSSGAEDWEALQRFDGELRAVAYRQTLLDGCTVLAGGGAISGIQVLATDCSETEMPGAFYEYSITIGAMAWSRDGLLASGGVDGVVLLHSFLWGGAGLELQATLTGHGGAIWGLSWAPRETRLATSSGDGTVRFWTVGGAIKPTELIPGLQSAALSVSGWKADMVCQNTAWIVSSPERLACSRATMTGSGTLTTELAEEPFTWMMEYVLIDFDDSVKLLSGMTYGQLSSADLQALGYQDLSGAVLDLEIISA